jgi:hypothetical protein
MIRGGKLTVHAGFRARSVWQENPRARTAYRSAVTAYRRNGALTERDDVVIAIAAAKSKRLELYPMNQSVWSARFSERRRHSNDPYQEAPQKIPPHPSPLLRDAVRHGALTWRMMRSDLIGGRDVRQACCARTTFS